MIASRGRWAHSQLRLLTRPDNQIWSPTTSNRFQATFDRFLATSNRFRATSNRFRATSNRFQATSKPLPSYFQPLPKYVDVDTDKYCYETDSDSYLTTTHDNNISHFYVRTRRQLEAKYTVTAIQWSSIITNDEDRHTIIKRLIRYRELMCMYKII